MQSVAGDVNRALLGVKNSSGEGLSLWNNKEKSINTEEPKSALYIFIT